MIALPKNFKIYFSLQPIDMRKAIDGLCVLVAEDLKRNPQGKALYIFYNKSRNKIKGIVWDSNGFMMIYKRLEKGRFKVPKDRYEEAMSLSQEELRWLLGGLDFMTLSRSPSMIFGSYA